MTELTFREQMALLGSTIVKAAPFWYMGPKGAVNEVAEREQSIVELMMMTAAPYEDCSAAVAAYAEGELYPDWRRFRQTAKDALIASLRIPSTDKENPT